MQVPRSWRLEFWIFWWDYDSIVLSLFFDIRCLQKFTAKCFSLVWVGTFTSKNITLDFCSLHLEWLKELSWFADFVVQIAFASAYARDVKRTVICYFTCEYKTLQGLARTKCGSASPVLGFAWGHWKPFLATSSWDCKGVQGRFLRSIHPSFWLTFWKLGWMTSKQM